MTTIALVHPEHGTQFVYDFGERDRHLKLGWKVRPDNWKDLKLAEDKAKKLAGLKADAERFAAEAAALEAEEVVPVVERKKPGPKPKA
jgi:hypothetical protein